jgi:ABC-type Zn2+ transport system substrate-binding protein/surface adhesin
MGELIRYIRKARASRHANFRLPIVTSPEEAKAIAAKVGAELAALPPNEKLSLLSDLQVLSDALEGRIRRLDEDMAETRLKLQQVRLSRRVCRSYAQSAAAVIQLHRRR